MLVTWGFVRPLTRCLHNAILAAIGRNQRHCNIISSYLCLYFYGRSCSCSCLATRFHPVLHKLVSCDRPCDCRTDYTNWNKSHRLAKWHDTWNAEETLKLIEIVKTRMCANAQGDGRPAEYRWRPLFNAAKFGGRPLLLECRAGMLPRHETHWNLLGVPN